MNNAQTAPKVTKETKNKIRVDFGAHLSGIELKLSSSISIL